jgi:hypothetical protein
MNSGIVKFFDVAPTKQFGFITYNGSEIFFHQSYGGVMACLGGDTPVFVKMPVARIPKASDTLLFEMDRGNRGFRATAWAFPETLIEAQKQIEARPIYRLVERRGFAKVYGRLYRDTRPKYEVLWEGKNLTEVKSLFPKDKFPIVEEDMFARYFKVFTADKSQLLDYEGDPR